MKNFLLTAFCVLVGLSPALAQETKVVYAIGDPVNSAEELTSGKYFLRAHVKNGESFTERIVRGSDDQLPANALTLYTTYDFSSGFTDNTYAVWELEVFDKDTDIDKDANQNKVFTIKNLALGWHLSVNGDSSDDPDYPANGSVSWNCDYLESDPPARFQLVKVGLNENNTYFGSEIECARFFMQLTNGKIEGRQYPYIHSDGDEMLFGVGATIDGAAVQFDLVAAKTCEKVDIYVQFPALNGKSVGLQTVTVPLGIDPSKAISDYANKMGYGDFTLTGLTDAAENGNPITTNFAAGQTIYANGVWARALKTNVVYRVRFEPKPNAAETYGAMRYRPSDGAIQTKFQNESTLTRIVPERLWYFTETEGGLLLHTLYDPDAFKGGPTPSLQFTKTSDDSWFRASATLGIDGTALEYVSQDDGTFYMKIAGTEGEKSAWLTNLNGNMLTIWEGDINGTSSYIKYCKMCLYPLTNNDFDALKDFAEVAQIDIEEAKKYQTVDYIKPLVDKYNEQNIDAALKRVEYFMGKKSLGHNPGQYSDPQGLFLAAVENLRDVAAKENATDTEKQEAIDAVNYFVEKNDPTVLVRNQVEAGFFYRFKNIQHPKYISVFRAGVTDGKTAMSMTDDGMRTSTVFYVEQVEGAPQGTFNVISLENGLVLPNMKKTSSSLEPAQLGSADASTGVIFQDMEDGSFAIQVDATDDCYLKSNDNGAMVIVGNNADLSGNEPCWTIERVENLPLTFYNVINQTPSADGEIDGWTSIYSPVALKLPKEYGNTTAYTGILDVKDYHTVTNINHVLATPIAKEKDGSTIIPANQPTLIFYRGSAANEHFLGTKIEGRENIYYLNFPILYGDKTPVSDNSKTSEEGMRPLSGSFYATPKQDGTKFYTLHASSSNNFSDFEKFKPGYTSVPGFKAFFGINPDKTNDYVTDYPICVINPNLMATTDEKEEFAKLVAAGNVYKFEDTADGNSKQVTIVLPSFATTENLNQPVHYTCELYYKTTPVVTEDGRSRIVSHDGYELADVAAGDEVARTFPVELGNRVDYYVYHPATDTKSAVRTFTLYSNGSTVGITDVEAKDDREIVCYDLQGRRLAAPVKGLNIINGRKVFVR